jgi:hypothetical protein
MCGVLVKDGRALPPHDNPALVPLREGQESVLQGWREIERCGGYAQRCEDVILATTQLI